MCNLLTNDRTIGLISDFHSRTKNKDNYVKPDANLLQLLDVFDDRELPNYMCDFVTLENQNVPLQRISLDITNPNDFGHLFFVRVILYSSPILDVVKIAVLEL